jgi:hypothetical protein
VRADQTQNFQRQVQYTERTVAEKKAKSTHN